MPAPTDLQAQWASFLIPKNCLACFLSSEKPSSLIAPLLPQDLRLRQPPPLQAASDLAAPTASGATWDTGGCGTPARQLLRKLRWATVGPRYDWTAREYDLSAPHRPLPTFAAEAAQRIAGLLLARTCNAAAACEPEDAAAGRRPKCAERNGGKQPEALRCGCHVGALGHPAAPPLASGHAAAPQTSAGFELHFRTV